MKVIGHEAPREDIGKWFNVTMHFLKEEQIVFFVKEYLLPIVSLIKYVVDMTLLEMHELVLWFSFSFIYFKLV